MTTDANPAEAMIKQAARAITACIGPDRKWADCTPLLFARALHDAGLLADPVDRDANTRVAARNALEWRMVARKNEDRAERAEAEVAELRATIDRVRALADEWEDDGPGCQLWPAYRRLRAALDGGGQ